MHHTKIFEQINGHPQYVNEKSANLLNEQLPTLTAVIYYYINMFISHKSDFRFKSNFAGAV